MPSRSDHRSYRLCVEQTPYTYILKRVHPKWEAAIAHELAILPYLHEHGFPVPKVPGVEGGLLSMPETVVLRIRLPGMPASARFGDLDIAARGGLLAAMGALLARVHVLPLAEVHEPVDRSTNFV